MHRVRLDWRQRGCRRAKAVLRENGRWVVTGGTDLDGEAVTLVVKLYGGRVIITLY